MKDPYKVLGLDSSATPDQLKQKYNELRAIYAEQRFKSGEEGNEGARKLQELEEAWAALSDKLERDTVTSSTGEVNYGVVDELIRQGKYDEAQNFLDGVQQRGSEWHYMQAIVFYKREWLTESKAQLEMALAEDPNNPKYKASLEKLTMVMNGGRAAQGNANNNGAYNNNNGGTYNAPPPQYDNPPPQQQQDMSNWLSTCCCAYCLTDCLCNAMRCC